LVCLGDGVDGLVVVMLEVGACLHLVFVAH
jgi:hypothetical protein